MSVVALWLSGLRARLCSHGPLKFRLAFRVRLAGALLKGRSKVVC